MEGMILVRGVEEIGDAMVSSSLVRSLLPYIHSAFALSLY